MSQSEEEEFRKMAEIADAINDILENNKLDDERDTPLEGTSADVDADENDADTQVHSEETPTDNLDEGLEAALDSVQERYKCWSFI